MRVSCCAIFAGIALHFADLHHCEGIGLMKLRRPADTQMLSVFGVVLGDDGKGRGLINCYLRFMYEG